MEAGEQPAAGQSPGGLSGQKRPRDFGEVLKGLTPEREQDNDTDSPSSLKKIKTSHIDDDDRDQSDSLDDGEIVESPSQGPDAAPQNAVASQVVESQASAISVLPQVDHNDEQAIEKPVSMLQSGDANDTESGSQAPTSWNQGVSLGLRTSFSSKKDGKTTPTSASEIKTDKTATSSSANRGSRIMTFKSKSTDWKMSPAGFQELEWRPDGSLATPAFWSIWIQDNTDNILQVLLEHNEAQRKDIPKRVMKSAIKCVLRDEAGILHGTERQKVQARRAANEASKKMKMHLKHNRVRTGSGQVPQSNSQTHDSESELSDDQEDPSTDSSIRDRHGDNPSRSESVLVEEEQKQLYFPGSENYSTFCTHCVSTKHDSMDCPQLTCEFCGSKTHSRFSCPSKRRCTKCHQFGHSKDACQEKLALAKEEQPPCAFCGASHTEDNCDEIWRSFNPSEVDIRRVKSIPIFCSTCGSEGHYGPECGLPGRGGQPIPASRIWSRANRDLYVDPESPNIAIAWVGVDMDRIQGQTNFHIRGKATKQTHIQYISSDGSDEDFIHKPVKNNGKPRGNIKINANTASNPQRQDKREKRRGGRQQETQRQGREFSPPPPPPQSLLSQPPHYQNNGRSQPPLPAGPPPPLRSSGFSSSSAPIQYALPPRPNVGTSQSRSHNEGGRSRGRGRGRGGRDRRRGN
jgi:protein AIR1/2